MPATGSAAEASAPGIVRPICRRMKRELTARGTQLIKPRRRARLRRSRRRKKARAASGAPTAENRSSSRTLDFIPLAREGTKSGQAKRAEPRHPLRRAEPTNRAAQKGRQPDLPRPGKGSSNPLPSSRQSVWVWAIERKLAEDAARPILWHNRTGTCWHPYVKGYTLMVNSVYNGWRMEDVWLDR